MNHHIAVDIGGTTIRVGLFPSTGELPVKVERVSTLGKNSKPIDRLYGLIESVWPDEGIVHAMGVAVPGYLDPETGVVLSAPNIPGWVDLPLLRLLQARFPTTVMLGNDANLAAMGEWKYGSGKGYKNVLYITISTGIGGGVIVNNSLLTGAHGLAAELGHVTILPDGPLCSCGQKGHLEALSSGTAIAAYVKEKLALGVSSSLQDNKTISAYEVALAAESGDTLALEALDRAAEFLGVALANFLHIFNPSIIILGGGVLRSGSRFLEKTQLSLASHVITPAYLSDLQVTTSLLGDDSGLMGALALARTGSLRSEK
jgi:glucokinase